MLNQLKLLIISAPILMGLAASAEQRFCADPLVAQVREPGTLVVPESVPMIEWTKLTDLKPFDSPIGDGGNSTSYTAKLGNEMVHVKVLDGPKDYELVSSEIYFYNELSRRGMSPQLKGLAQKGDSYAIVSEFVVPVATLKTILRDPFNNLSRVLNFIKACPVCKADWPRRLESIAKFLEESRTTTDDLQVMLLNDGRILLYDFQLYQIVPQDQKYTRINSIQLIDLAKRIRQER